MNRSTFAFGTLSLVLALTSATFAGSSTEKADENLGRRPSMVRSPISTATDAQQAVEPRARYQRLQRQIEELRAGHQELIAQLEAIQKQAVKEKAQETANQVQALISKRQDSFQNTLRQLEQQQLELQQAGRDRTQRPGLERLPRVRGKQAPDFELNSFDGRNVKLSNYKGRIVVLEWMNPECPFSRYHYETTPTMANLAKKYKDKEVVWLAVNSTNNTTPEANRDFAQKHKLPYPILDDRSGQVGRLYGARNTPHVFVIDKAGMIAYEGAIDNAPLGKQEPGAGTVNYVDKAVSELLAGQNVSLPNTPPYGCTVKYAQQ
jgi:peroxiredoxin/soluble cytochrome b562